MQCQALLLRDNSNSSAEHGERTGHSDCGTLGRSVASVWPESLQCYGVHTAVIETQNWNRCPLVVAKTVPHAAATVHAPTVTLVCDPSRWQRDQPDEQATTHSKHNINPETQHQMHW